MLGQLIGTLPGPLEGITLVHDDRDSQEVTFYDDRLSSSPPDAIAGYELLGEVGRGGMGVVYKARQRRPDRIVALKMLLAGRHAGSKERTRFLYEAEAIAQLQHPHIVPLYEAGQHGELPYFTLEFISGGSLSNLLKASPLLPADAARMIEQLADAMHYAHQRGIIHRDLKPANVLLSTGGTTDRERMGQNLSGTQSSFISCVPKITDFGLAKNIADASTVTSTGAVFGTPSYMAPEQASGDVKQVGAAADVYALGAILYECLTGRPPFRGPTPAETLLQVLSQEPAPPSILQRSVPRDLETICLKCLRKEPQRRYTSALELAEDVRRFRANEPIKARPVGRIERGVKWCRRHPGVASLTAAVVLLTLIGTGLVTWKWRQAVTALEEARNEKAARARRQVAALPDAAAKHVPAILEELEASRTEVLPLLRQLYQDEKEQPRRMRLALALLPVESNTLREPLTDWMLHAEDPAEVLLARDALAPYRAELVGPLWAMAENIKSPEAVRFRAMVALAKYDSDDPRWLKLGPEAAERVLWANPLHQGLWTEAMRPIGQALLAPQAESSYLPLKVGTKWHYFRDTGDGVETNVVMQIDKIEVLDGVPCARATSLEGGNNSVSEHVRSTSQGIFRHRYQGRDISPPLQLLKFPIKIGETWKGEHREVGRPSWKVNCRVGREEVVVPAGTYDAVTVTAELDYGDGMLYTLVWWYAEGVGVVQQKIENHQVSRSGFLSVIALMTSPDGAGPFRAVSTLIADKAKPIIIKLEKFEAAR